MKDAYDDDTVAPKAPGKSRETPAFDNNGSYGGHADPTQYSGTESHPLHVSGSEHDRILRGHVAKESKFGEVFGGKGC